MREGTELLIEIPCLPPAEYSGNSRACWQARYQANWGRQGPGRTCYLCAVDARNRADWQAPERATMEVEVIFRDRRKRDNDNLISRLKVFQDALVEAEIIKGDDVDHLSDVRLQITVDRTRAPLTVIRIGDSRDYGYEGRKAKE